MMMRGKAGVMKKTGNLFANQKTNILEEKLLTLISEKQKTYNGEVYEFTLRNGFLPTHTVEIFSALQSAGKLDVSSDDDEKVRKGHFILIMTIIKRLPKKSIIKSNNYGTIIH